MYSVQQLSKMYKCTRQTIYVKLEHPDIQPYITKNEKGLRLLPEGLSVLNTILSESKLRHDIQEVDSNLDIPLTTKTSYIDKYILSLEEQIKELKLDKEKLYSELEQQ